MSPNNRPCSCHLRTNNKRVFTYKNLAKTTPGLTDVNTGNGKIGATSRGPSQTRAFMAPPSTATPTQRPAQGDGHTGLLLCAHHPRGRGEVAGANAPRGWLPPLPHLSGSSRTWRDAAFVGKAGQTNATWPQDGPLRLPLKSTCLRSSACPTSKSAKPAPPDPFSTTA